MEAMACNEKDENVTWAAKKYSQTCGPGFEKLHETFQRAVTEKEGKLYLNQKNFGQTLNLFTCAATTIRSDPAKEKQFLIG